MFAQAASVRNGAQSAADAAALAAAQDARDELVDTVTGAIGQGNDWLDWLNGQDPPGAGATAAAEALATENGATVQGGAVPVVRNGYPGFRVAVETINTVGASIIPGTEGMRARARATAVIQPRCDFDPDADPTQPIELNCDGQLVTIDPINFDPDDFPDASVLFSVRLVE